MIFLQRLKQAVPEFFFEIKEVVFLWVRSVKNPVVVIRGWVAILFTRKEQKIEDNEFDNNSVSGTSGVRYFVPLSEIPAFVEHDQVKKEQVVSGADPLVEKEFQDDNAIRHSGLDPESTGILNPPSAQGYGWARQVQDDADDVLVNTPDVVSADTSSGVYAGNQVKNTFTAWLLNHRVFVRRCIKYRACRSTLRWLLAVSYWLSDLKKRKSQQAIDESFSVVLGEPEDSTVDGVMADKTGWRGKLRVMDKLRPAFMYILHQCRTTARRGLVFAGSVVSVVKSKFVSRHAAESEVVIAPAGHNLGDDRNRAADAPISTRHVEMEIQSTSGVWLAISAWPKAVVYSLLVYLVLVVGDLVREARGVIRNSHSGLQRSVIPAPEPESTSWMPDPPSAQGYGRARQVRHDGQVRDDDGNLYHLRGGHGGSFKPGMTALSPWSAAFSYFRQVGSGLKGEYQLWLVKALILLAASYRLQVKSQRLLNSRRLKAGLSLVLVIAMTFSPVLPSLDPLQLWGALTSRAATVTWDNGGADNFWSTAGNWSEERVPTADDIVVFDESSPTDAVVDTDISVAGIEVAGGYKATISVRSGKRVVVGRGGFRQNGGTFSGGTAPMDILGSVSLLGGTFTAPSSVLSVKGNLSFLGGDFKHNGGTVALNGIEQVVFGSAKFNNFSKIAQVRQSLILQSGATLSFAGQLTLKGSAPTPGGQADENALRVSASKLGEGATLNVKRAVETEYLIVDNVEGVNTTADVISASSSGLTGGSRGVDAGSPDQSPGQAPSGMTDAELEPGIVNDTLNRAEKLLQPLQVSGLSFNPVGEPSVSPPLQGGDEEGVSASIQIQPDKVKVKRYKDVEFAADEPVQFEFNFDEATQKAEIKPADEKKMDGLEQEEVVPDTNANDQISNDNSDSVIPGSDPESTPSPSVPPAFKLLNFFRNTKQNIIGWFGRDAKAEVVVATPSPTISTAPSPVVTPLPSVGENSQTPDPNSQTDSAMGLGVNGADQKTASDEAVLGESNSVRNSGLSTNNQYSKEDDNVKSDNETSQNTVEVGGVEPPDSWMTSPSSHQATPTADSSYHDNGSVAGVTDIIPPNPAGIVAAALIMPDGTESADILPQVSVIDGKTMVEVPQPQGSFKPGKYTLRLSLRGAGSDEAISVDQDFTWGVLAMNFDKSSYTPEEEVNIGMAVLDDGGHTICDASLELEITGSDGNGVVLKTSEMSNAQFPISNFQSNPNDSMTNADNGGHPALDAGSSDDEGVIPGSDPESTSSITTSGSCADRSVTNIPDYSAQYKVEQEGEYTVKLTAETENGTRNMTQTFNVNDKIQISNDQTSNNDGSVIPGSDPESTGILNQVQDDKDGQFQDDSTRYKDSSFITTRDAPTRIYPPADYPVTITLEAHEDFEGSIVEQVPEGFEIKNISGEGAVVTAEGIPLPQWNRLSATVGVGGDDSGVVVNPTTDSRDDNSVIPASEPESSSDVDSPTKSGNDSDVGVNQKTASEEAVNEGALGVVPGGANPPETNVSNNSIAKGDTNQKPAEAGLGDTPEQGNTRFVTCDPSIADSDCVSSDDSQAPWTQGELNPRHPGDESGSPRPVGPRQDSLYHESGSVAGITDASPTPDDNSVIPGSDPESTGILNQVQDDDAVRHSGSQNPESTGNDNETTEQWNNGDQYIVWENVSIKAGEKIELKYTFKAPDVSPEFYLLGPLKLTTHNLELGTDSSSVVPDLPTGQAGSEPESTSGTTGPVVLGNEGPPASTAGNPSFAWVEPRSWQIAADASVFDQKHFRIYEDDAALNSATAYAAEDTNKSVLIGANFRLRFSVANTGDAAGDITRRLEFSEDAGDWTQITTGTNNVRLVNSTEFTDGDATTALLTPTGTFAAGQGKDTGSDTSQISLTNAYYVEDEYALKFETAADGHSYQFRITNAGTAISYTNTPNIAATTKQYMGGDEDGWAVAESITFQWPALTDAGYTWPEDPQDGTEQYAGGDEDGWDTGSNAFVWVGAGVDSNCSTVANWDQGAVPDTFNDIIFDDTDTTDAVWDSGCPATVRSLSLVSGYTGTVSLGQSIAVSTNLALQAGTLDASDDAGVTSYNLTVAGNWTNSGGTFTARTGTVTLDGTNQSLSGTNTFYNLTKTEASDDSTDATLTIGASSTQTITNTLNIGGLDDNDRLNLVSSTPSTKWTFDITAADLWVRWLDVTDGQASTNDIVATQSVGSNTDAGEATPHWEFGVTKTWAAAAAANCSAAAGNWSPAALPTRADDILLNATSTQNLTWDATCPQEVYSYTQDTGYTGTATINTVYGESGFTVFTTMDDLTINAGTMAHGDNSTAETYNLDISVGGDLTVASGGTINVDGLGYNAGYGPGIGSSTQAGGSYGGLGGVYTGVAGSTYGSVTAPVNLGSGSSVANAGGGAILLTVTGSSTISGTISANGNGGTQYYSGAGGSVYLTTGTITGAGTVIANGGSVTDALTGGGGRVAIVLTGSSADFSSFGSATVTAYGGSGITTSLGGWGAAGTVYKQTTIEGAGHGDLIIDNNNPPTQYQQPLLGVTTAIPGSTSWSGFTSITMRNAGIIGVPTSTTLDITNVTMNGDSTNYNGGVQLSGGTFTTPAAFSYTNYLVRILSASTFNPVTSVTVGNQATLIDDVANTFSGDLIIDSGGNITHDANWSTALGEQYKVNLTIGGDLSVNGTGTINVNGKGYSTGNGPGYGSSTQAGGSYGGLGAIYSGVVGKTYGSATAPVNIGSGGSGGGAAGGGAAILTVSGLSTIAGTIGADGADPVDYWGGSGGSVYLTTGTITGSGTISANGGSAPNQDSGGGGRVAVILTGGGADFSGFSGGSITAYGGTTPSSGTHGAAGTVYKQTTAQGSGYGDLIIDNNSLGSQASVVTDLDGEDANTDTTVGSVTIANAGKFKIGSDDALTVSGAITVASGTTLDNDGALTADNIANSGTASFDTASNTLTLLGDGDAAADSYTLTDIATTFYNLILNATDGSLDTFVLGNNMTAGGVLTVTSGVFSQGASYNLIASDGGATGTAVSIASGGTWMNNGTGGITLGGGVVNDGYVRIDANDDGCGGDDNIAITSSAGGTVRTWSGSGTYRIYDVSATDQADSSITVYSSAMSNTTWTNNPTCPNLRTWKGTGNWSTAANWTGDTKPAAGDLVIFDATSTADATIDENTAALLGIDIRVGYTGTITQSSTYTVSLGASGYTQADGTLTTGSGGISVGGSWTKTGGTFTPGSNTVTFTGAGTIIPGGQAFNAVTIDASGNTVTAGAALDINGVFSLAAGTFNQSTYTMNVAGDFTITDGATFTKSSNSSALTFDGDLTLTDNSTTKQDLGALVIGASPDTTDLAEDMAATSLTINDGDFLYTNGYDLDITNDITIAADGGSGGGTLDATDDVAGDLTAIALGGDWSNSGTFTAADSTVTFDGAGTYGMSGSAAHTFYGLAMSGTGTFDNSSNNTSYTVQGGLTVASGVTYTKGTGTITLGNDTADGTQAIDLNDATVEDLVVNGSGDTKQLSSGVTTDSLTVTAGTLDLNGQALSLASAQSVSNAGTVKMIGSETITNVNDWDYDSGTVEFYGDGTGAATTHTITDIGTAYNNLTINDPAASNKDTFQLGEAMTIAGDFTNTAGTFDANSQTVTLNGTNQTLTGDTTWYNLTKQESTDDATDSTLTIAASSTQQVAGTLDLDGLDDDDRLNLVSSSPATAYTFDVTGADQWAMWLDVTDANASTSDIIAPYSVNGGGNDDGDVTPFWVFPTSSAYPMVWAAAGAANCSAAASNWTINGTPAGALPTKADDILLNATSTQNLTWDASCPQTIYKYTQDTGYSGTVTVSTVYGESGFILWTVHDDLTINAGTMAHADNSTAETYNLDISVGGDFTLGASGAVTVDGLGYNTYYGPGALQGYNSVDGSTGYTGGTHGGKGGNVYDLLSTYGSIIAPTNLGSGGGWSGGGHGGGAVYLSVSGTSLIDGTISADGTDYSSNSNAGKGAGGSAYISTGTISGESSGVIRANGGSGTGQGGGGGGGRVAAVLTGVDADFTNFAGTTTAYGGTSDSSRKGAAGTVYKQTQAQGAGGGELIIDNNNLSTARGVTTAIVDGDTWDTNDFDTLTLANSGIVGVGTGETLDISTATVNDDTDNTNEGIYLDGGTLTTASAYSFDYRVWLASASTFDPATSVTVQNLGTLQADVAHTFSGDITVQSGGNITHSDNSTTEAYKLNLTISGDLTVDSGGTINVDGLGYASGYGPGNPGVSSSGASYGGIGGVKTAGTGPTYGSITAPTNIGSGGGAASKYGGGAVILTVSGASTVDGTISADGSGSTSAQAGSSGGSVYLTTGTISGSGTIETIGQVGENGYSGGGGGRVSIILTSGSSFDSISITAYGGDSSYDGAAGTVYKQTQAQGSGGGTLTIDNNNLSVAAGVVTDLDGEDANTDTVVGSVTLSNAGKFQVGSDDALTVGGTGTTVNIASGTTLTNNGTLTLGGTAFTNSGTWTNDAASTTTFTGQSDDSAVTLPNPTYGALEVNNAGSTFSLGGATTAAGSVTITAGTLDATASNYTLNVGGNWVNNDAFTQRSGTVTFDGAGTYGISGSGTHTFYSLAMSAGTFDNSTNNASYAVQGDLTIDSGITYTAGTGTITFSGATAAQTADFGGKTVEDITVNKSAGRVTLGGDVTTDGLTITDGIFDQGADSDVTVTDEDADGTAVTVAAGATWQNLGTGDVALGGDVTNDGYVKFMASGSCGGTDEIAITSTASPTQRTWSGSGSYRMRDVSATDQAGTVTTISSTLSNSTWTNTTDTCPAEVFWDGSAGDNNWDTGANWTSGAKPTTSQVGVFDSTSSEDATTATNVSVLGVVIEPVYEGTITQASTHTITIGTSGWTQRGAIFTGGDSLMDINGNFAIPAGTFSSTSGEMQIAGDFTYGGTFTNNSSGVTADGSGDRTWDVGATEVFNDLTVNIATGTLTTNGETLQVDGMFTWTDGAIDQGTVDANGTVTVAATADGHTTTSSTLQLTGVGAQTCTLNGGGAVSVFTINNASATCTLAGSGTFTTEGDASVTAGTLNLAGISFSAGSNTLTVGASGTFRLQGSETMTAGTKTFNAGSDVIFTGDGDGLEDTYTVTGQLPSPLASNLEINSVDGATDTFQLGAAGDYNGTFDLTAGTFDQAAYALNVAGNFTITDGAVFTKSSNGSALTFDGDLTFTDGSATKQDMGDVAIGASPDTTDLASDMTATSLTIGVDDILNTNGYDLDITNDINIASVAYLDATDDVAGDATMISLGGDWNNTGGFSGFTAADSTVTFDGGDQAVNGSTTFYNFTKTDAADDSTDVTLTFEAATTQTITNMWTLTGIDDSDRVNMTSSTGSSVWYIDLGAAPNTHHSISKAEVAWSENLSSGGNIVVCEVRDGGNNTAWTIWGLCAVSGVIYTDEGSTNIGANKTVAVAVNGTKHGTTDETDAGGAFAISDLTVAVNDILTIFVDNETEDGVTVSVSDGVNITDLDVYQDRLIARHDNYGSISNANLVTASTGDDGDGVDATDVSNIYTASGTSLTVADGKELFILAGYSMTPGGTVTTHDMDINGTFDLEANAAYVSGTWDATGGTFTNASGRVVMTGTGSETITSDSQAFNDLYINDGLVGYWKFDEAAAGTFADSSGYGNTGTGYGATGTNNTPQPTATVPTVNFTDPYALDFDGTDDYVGVSSTISSVKTIAFWIKADDTTTRKVINIDGTDQIELNASSQVVATSFPGTTTIYVDGAVSPTITTSWKHVVITDTTGVSASSLEIGSVSTSYFDGAMDDVRMYNRALSAEEIARLAGGNMPRTSVGTYTLGDALDVDGSLTLASGKLDVSASDYAVDVANDWENDGGEFTARSGTVTLSGVSTGYELQTGGEPFNNLTIADGSRTLADHLYADETISQAAGTLDTSSSNWNIYAGHLSAAGTFTPNSSKITVDDTDSHTYSIDETTQDVAFGDTLKYGLVGYWKLDEGTGITAADSSGNGNDGTLTNGPAWTNASLPVMNYVNSYALDFDGVLNGTYVDFGNALKPSLPITFSAWIHPGGVESSGIIDLDKQGNGPHSGATMSFGSDGKISVGFGDNTYCGSSGRRSKVGNTVLNVNNWYHVIGIIRGATDMDIYIDGKDDGGTYSGTGGDMQYDGNNGMIGATQACNGGGPLELYTFNGTLDEVRVYNRSLLTEEIRHMYMGGMEHTPDATGTYTLGAALDVDNDLWISDGTLDVSSGPSYGINVAGDWYNEGTLTAQSGTVTLDGTDQGIYGTTTFNNLTKIQSADDSTDETLTFEAGKTQTISSALTLNGIDNEDRINLRSSVSGTQWSFSSDTEDLTWLDVADSNNLGALITVCEGLVIEPEDNNTNWAVGGVEFTQNDWRWYYDNDELQPTDAWGNPDLNENEEMMILPASNDTAQRADELRARVNLNLSGSCPLIAGQNSFKLQYATDTGGSWTDVGAGGGGDIWRYATSSVSDGTTLTGALIASTDVLETYVKTAASTVNPNGASAGQDIEYDFHIEHNGATDNQTYYFRVVETDDTALDGYEVDGYPALETRPGTVDLMRHGNFWKEQDEKGFLWAD